LVNAAQIACFAKKEYKLFVYKGLHYGLKSSHLKQIPLLMKIIQEIEDFEKTTEYKMIRQNYLASLNFDYLSWIYDLGMEDQIEKRKPDYAIYTLNYINELVEKIHKNGLPSNRIIGIGDNLWKVECSQDNVNALRAKYHIVPLEVDKAKRSLEKEHGFKLSWGFWDCL